MSLFHISVIVAGLGVLSRKWLVRGWLSSIMGSGRPNAEVQKKVADQMMAILATRELQNRNKNMNKGNTSREKVVAAFKGFIRTYKLLPPKERKLIQDSEYSPSFKFFCSEAEMLELFYKVEAYDRVIDLADRLYYGQTDRQFVSKCLKQTTTEWIEQGHNIDDQPQLEQAAASFLDKVEREITDRIVYIPIEGIEVNSSRNLQLARCQLCRNFSDSELMMLVRQSKEKFPETLDEFLSSFEQAPAFFKVSVSGHSKRVIEEGEKEVELALNVLRLFLGSFYSDVYRQSSGPRCMGLIGTLHTGEHSHVLYVYADVPIEEQFPGSSVKIRHHTHMPFTLDNRTVEGLKELGLARINQHLHSVDNGGDVARRLLRAIEWFGKATTASSVVECFLMLAISVEALLSDGRTPKETYAKRIAALVTRHGREGLYPYDGYYVSSEFGEELKNASCQSERFNVVRNKVEKLFEYRNDIAHGSKLEGEIDALHSLDLETLVRNSILSFVDGGWNTLGEFKNWVNPSVTYSFCPRPLS